jgi:hypothetical protein
MRISFLKRLRAMTAAMAASREARAAELERRRTDPDFFSQTGGVSLNFFYASWPMATLSGDKYSLYLRCPTGVFSSDKLFLFPRSRILRLSKYWEQLSIGLRIEHADEVFPRFIVFWTFDFTYLKSKLLSLGYDVED